MSTIEATRTIPSDPLDPSEPFPIPTSDRATLVSSAQRLASEASARADEIETARTIPIDLVRSLRQAGLFRLLSPASLGGLEVEPATVVDVVEALSHGDGSTGWCSMIGQGSFFFAYFEPSVARSMVGDGDVTCAGVFAPKGRAVETEPGAFTVDGRWSFNSGVNHAEHLFEGVMVTDGPAPRFRDDGSPDWRFACVPRHGTAGGGSVEVIDTWHALGLRGSGSNDVVIEGVRVPEEHMVFPFTTHAPHDGPLWRFDFMGLLGIAIAGVPLGIARRALDEVVSIAPQRFAMGSRSPIAADPLVQHRLGRADAGIRAARALVDDAIGSAWSTACRGDRPSPEQHTAMQVAVVEALEASTRAVDTAFVLGGSGAVLDSSRLQRCFRDIHTVAQHPAFAGDVHGDVARARLGAGA